MTLFQRITARRCNGCEDTSVHTHHLTWFGRWYFIGRYRRVSGGTE